MDNNTENKKTFSQTNLRSYIIMVIIIVVVLIAGTFTWMSYRSKNTALVLTIGQIDGLQVTLKPYQVTASLTPTNDYTTQEYVNVTAQNKKPTAEKFRLYYHIDSIAQELIDDGFKYTIVKSTNNWSSQTVVKNGNFSTASNSQDLEIYTEEVPGNNTTYQYKVYLWIDSSDGNQSAMQGKIFKGELRAEILSYLVTFDPNGGSINQSTKTVTYGEQYGTLPTPTRDGYEFLGWNGVQLLEDTDTLSEYNIAPSQLDTINTLDGSYSMKVNRLWDGIYINLKKLYEQGKIKLNDSVTFSIYYKTNYSNGNNLSINLWRATKAAASGVDCSSGNIGNSIVANEWYRINCNVIINDFSIQSTTARFEPGGYYDPNDAYYLGNDRQNYIWFARPQVQLGNNITAYEPYYITDTTTVVQNKNHTLTAIWGIDQ